MFCPDCAEEIQDAARKCRFCGRDINEADRRGYPSFYNRVLEEGLDSPAHLLADYADSIEAGGSDRINTDNLCGYLFTWGKLNEFDLLRGMRKALFERASDILGGPRIDNIFDRGAESVASRFGEIENQEAKACYLMARYIESVEAYGKRWPHGIAIKRNDPTEISGTIDFLKETISIAERSPAGMENSISHLRHELAECERQLKAVRDGSAVHFTTESFKKMFEKREEIREPAKELDKNNIAISVWPRYVIGAIALLFIWNMLLG